MRKALALAGMAALLLVSGVGAKAAAPAKGAPGTIVIVFKDGHRQTFNLADIERVEFPAGAPVATDAGPAGGAAVPRGRYFGKWEVGDGAGGTFIITLNEDGTAHRTLREINGHWKYVNGEADITWDDGAMDAIRREGNRFQKFAYVAGKTFHDAPDNVTEAHNTSPRPI